MATERHVTVLGSGIIGLTCAIRLAEKGARVTVLSKDFGPGLASDQCGGLWEPFHVEPAELVQPWSLATYKQLVNDSAYPEATGVRPWKHFQFHGPGQEARRDVLPYWGEDVGMQIVKAGDPRLDGRLPPGYCGAWLYQTFVADMAVYMPFLQDRCKTLGIDFQVYEVKSLDEAAVLARGLAGNLEAQAILVNCTGLGARALCKDDRLRPGRGVVVKTRRPPTIDAVYDDMGDGTDETRPTYIIPKGDLVTLGGLYQLDNWNTSYTEDEAHDIVARCCQLAPELRGAEVIGIWAGLRPVRDCVRIEKEQIESVHVIHCYGHGGAGVTVSWGCADHVVGMIYRL